MRKTLLVLFVCVFSVLANAQEIAVAAAADLAAVFPQVAQRFEKETGKKVKVSYGSSGQFLVQIENGAPYDLFFSADIQYPKRLEQERLVEPGSLYEYAVGKIVLYVPAKSPVDLSRGIRALLAQDVKKVAIANPQHAPYGRAAVEALKKEGVYDALQSKFVLGENISQTAQFVESGAADAGIIALSLALSPAMKSAGRFVEVPPADYTPLEQAAIVLKSAKDKTTARLFVEFLKKPETVKLMSDYGFAVPRAGKQ
jgi:molybdate transport system substrate-binding protein